VEELGGILQEGSGKLCIDYEAVNWALCYGRIDSVIKKIDDRKCVRKFTPRKPTASGRNQISMGVKKLLKEGKMTTHPSKNNVREKNRQNIIVEQSKTKQPPFPPGFLIAIKKNKQARQNFQRFAPNNKKQYKM
jgi:uncharacterized protein YdeI (YjbR/CyaY-like superfamily)